MQTKKKLLREVMTAVLGRGSKTCSFIEMRGLKLVYKRYASLYFCCAIGNSVVFTGVIGGQGRFWSILLFYPTAFSSIQHFFQHYLKIFARSANFRPFSSLFVS